MQLAHTLADAIRFCQVGTVLYATLMLGMDLTQMAVQDSPVRLAHHVQCCGLSMSGDCR